MHITCLYCKTQFVAVWQLQKNLCDSVTNIQYPGIPTQLSVSAHMMPVHTVWKVACFTLIDWQIRWSWFFCHFNKFPVLSCQWECRLCIKQKQEAKQKHEILAHEKVLGGLGNLFFIAGLWFCVITMSSRISWVWRKLGLFYCGS